MREETPGKAIVDRWRTGKPGGFYELERWDAELIAAIDSAVAKAKEQTRSEFTGAITEISAGRVLSPKTNADRACNDSAQRCMDIVKRYVDGDGLFQARRTP